MTETIAIALSGGVDSLVGAYLLKQQGHPVIGLHFTTGYEPGVLIGKDDGPGPETEYTDTLKKKMNRLGEQLHIPIEIVDLSKEFKRMVVDYFVHAYRACKTPNPCMVCNVSIKFGVLFDAARKLGANRLATGHYAGIFRDEKGNYHLSKGIDPAKDQSYFLARLNQSQLALALLPLGKLRKTQVVNLAKQEKLNPLFRSESQDVCFIHTKTYGDFLSREAGIKDAPGPIVDIHGNLLGEHRGLHFFTVGQRRGINCPAKEPYYVIGMTPGENTLVVGFKDHLFLSEFVAADINWIGEKPSFPINVMTRVRYRHAAVESVLTPSGDGHRAHVKFSKPQSSITPGQGAVFYQDDELLGGGWIER